MALFAWTPQMSIGVEQIDREHRGLVDAINAFHDSMLAGQAAGTLTSVLSKLIDYTQTHFRNEEQLLRRLGYPDFAAHKKEHDLLTANVLELKEGLGAGRIKASIETMRFLRDWLVNHIMRTDMAYKPFLAAKHVK